MVEKIGFETISLFWDYENVRQRRYYTCTITDEKETPYFKVKVHSKTGDPKEFSNTAPKGAWEEEILKSIQKERGDGNLLKFFPEFINGQSLFGLVECTIKRMMESLPGIPTIEKYNFRFGRTPILIKELPLALNPSGCIRSERFHKHRIRPLAMRTASDHSLTPTPAVDSSLNNDSWLSYPQRTAQILGTKTGQYRKMRQDWRNTVILGRSRIQGLGLFVKKDVEEVSLLRNILGVSKIKSA
ncbi:histone-lysine N-methyltransferase trr-like [Clytia hemisphaerica]|uniref:histone-lysine N-methyltransferase trr-like n=1 Tax=Clytia hemisphaerica TaxID=252671 RepID=UPI0034D40C3C